MVDLEKTEFLNVVQYLAELKSAIQLLYNEHKVIMSKSAHDDLERISLAGIIEKFNLAQLEEWQKGNELMGIKLYRDYIQFNLQITQECISIQASGDKRKPSIYDVLSKKEMQIVRLALGHWDAFSNLFYRKINHPDTLKLILKNIDDTSAQVMSHLTTGDENDIVKFYLERMEQAGTIIRKKIIDQESMSAPLSGSPEEIKLASPLSIEDWENIFNKLIIKEFVHSGYSESVAIRQWLQFAFSNYGLPHLIRNIKLQWLSDTVSLGQWIMTLVNEDGILYKENDKARLYAWVDRVIQYSGAKNTMQTDLRRALSNKVQNFNVRSEEGKFVFEVIQTAKKPKSRTKKD